MPIINAKTRKLNRIYVAYRLENVLLPGKTLREPRERVCFRLKPSTKSINQWLAKQGWSPPNRCNGGRAIDHYTRRFWSLYVPEVRTNPPKEWSTMMVINSLLDEVKAGNLMPFQNVDLITWPNGGRLIDYLAMYWYIYEGGKKNAR